MSVDFELTPYDEYHVHQSPYPFSYIPNTDLVWDDGSFYAVYNREGTKFLYCYMRVHPNNNMIDASIGLMYEPTKQYTIRMCRPWRTDYDMKVGPLSYSFPKPMREIRVVCEDNDFDLSCDLTWIAIAPPFLEKHHTAIQWGRLTSDQTRYTQNGTARGWIKFRGETIDVDPVGWWGTRDHSWGLYSGSVTDQRVPRSEYMPPPTPQPKERAFRNWVPAQFDDHSMFYHWHESREAEVMDLNDLFGNAFEGRIDFGFGDTRPPIKLVDVRHELQFQPGTRIQTGGTIWLKDERGKELVHEVKVVAPPWSPVVFAAWKDGWWGMGRYRGPLAMEADEYDFTHQPTEITGPSGRTMKVSGMEYIYHIREHSDEGVKHGWAQSEFHIRGRYDRYGFDKDAEALAGTH